MEKFDGIFQRVYHALRRLTELDCYVPPAIGDSFTENRAGMFSLMGQYRYVDITSEGRRHQLPGAV